jgi:hypothetical protein
MGSVKMTDQRNSEKQLEDKLACEIDVSSDSGLKDLKTLAKDSKFVCKTCGRAAASDEHICQPEWIY